MYQQLATKTRGQQQLSAAWCFALVMSESGRDGNLHAVKPSHRNTIRDRWQT